MAYEVRVPRPTFKKVEPKGKQTETSMLQIGMVISGLVLEINTGMKASKHISAVQAAKRILGYEISQRPHKFDLLDRMQALETQAKLVRQAVKSVYPELN